MKKIDAHSHIGKFGGWAGVDFNKQRIVEQMEEYEIEKTFLTASSFQGNDEVVDAFQSYPEKVVPFVWVNPALDNVEETLSELSKHFKLYIVSNCQESYMNAFLS